MQNNVNDQNDKEFPGFFFRLIRMTTFRGCLMTNLHNEVKKKISKTTFEFFLALNELINYKPLERHL